MSTRRGSKRTRNAAADAANENSVPQQLGPSPRRAKAPLQSLSGAAAAAKSILARAAITRQAQAASDSIEVECEAREERSERGDEDGDSSSSESDFEYEDGEEEEEGELRPEPHVEADGLHEEDDDFDDAVMARHLRELDGEDVSDDESDDESDEEADGEPDAGEGVAAAGEETRVLPDKILFPEGKP